MKKTKLFKRMLAGILAGVMCGSMSIGAFASEVKENGNIWYGDELSVDIKAGENGYTFRSVYAAPRHSYEMSNHMVSTNGGVNNDIPQTLVLVDASEDYTWTPNKIYSYGESNYEVLYCCDAVTGYEDNIYYKRLNLEDSNYYTNEEAAQIRAIVTNAYPYVSMEQMKSNLAAEGFEGAEELTRAEIISAVQAAIWAYANDEKGNYTYSQTFHVPDNSQWGGCMHDYTGEMQPIWWATGKRKFSTNEDVATRINSLIDYLKALDPVYPEKNQIIISDIKILDSVPVETEEDVFSVDLQVLLNNSGSSEEDTIALNVYVDDELVNTQNVELNTEQYDCTVLAQKGQTIKAVVSGTQMVSRGVYFYEPEGGRDVSQCLVGVASGRTDVYAQASIELYERIITFEKTTTSEQGKKPLEGIVFDIYYAGTVEEYTEYVEEVSKTYGGNKENSEEFMVAVQDKFEEAKANEIKAGNIAPVATVVTDINGNAVYNLTKDGQKDGIYLIIEREHPSVKAPLAPFAVAVPMNAKDGSGLVYEIELQPKNEVYIPEINKDVIEINNSEEQQNESVNAGEEFTWIVRGDIPADIADAKKYVITDTLDYRLTYAEDLVVKVEEVVAEADNSNLGNVLKENIDYKLVVTDVEGTVEGQNTKKITVSLTKVGMDKIAALVGEQGEDYEIRVYFNTIIDADATVGEDIPNQATLIYTNSANFETEVESDEPMVYTCGINIKKYDAKDATNYLAGAEFIVARKATDAEIADETIETESLVIAKGQPEVVVFVDFYNNAELTGNKVDTIVTNETGDAFVYGLEEGTYYLVETKAPAGYNLLSYPVNITLNKVSHAVENTVMVANSNSFVLPGTGGIGTTIFTLVGAALSLGSGAVLLGKKRKEEEE